MGIADFTTRYEYVRFHKDLTAERGRADGYSCVDCNKQARDWSLKEDGNPFKNSDYNPRCRSCHKKHDHTPEIAAKMSRSKIGNTNQSLLGGPK